MRPRRGSALFSVLAAVVIIMVATVFLMYGGWGPKEGGSGRADGGGKTTMGAARLAAKDTVCRQNLSQCRQALVLYRTTNDENPGSIEELKIGKTFYRCEVGGEPYNYDAQAGTVTCPHPGHEKY